MPGDGVKFGEAWVEIHAKLDEYEREIEGAEKRTTEAIDRIEVKTRGLSDTFRNVGQGFAGIAEGTKDLGILGMHAVAFYLQLTRWQRILSVIRFLFAGVTAGIAAAGAAFVLPIVFAGDLVRMIEKMPSAISRAVDWVKKLTFEDVQVGIGKAIQSIPIFGRALSETASVLSRALGGPDFTEDIRKAEEAVRRMRIEAEAMRDAFKAASRDHGLEDAGRNSRRATQLEDVEGPDRVRLETQFNEEDLVRQAREIGMRYAQVFHERNENLRRALEAEEITKEEFDIKMAADEQRRAQLLAMRDKDLTEALIAARAEGAAKLRQAEQQQAMQRADELESLNQQIIDQRVRLELAGADAQAEQIRLSFSRQIMQAEREGEEQRAALLRELAQLRIEEVRRGERDRFDAQAEEIAQGAARIQQEIARAELEGQNDPLSLRIFDIDADVNSRIDALTQKLIELRDAQAAVKGDNLVDHIQQFNAFGEQIRTVEGMIAALNHLREVRVANAKAEAADWEFDQAVKQKRNERTGQFSQVSLDQLSFGSPRQEEGWTFDKAMRDDGLEVQKASRDELKAIRAALERGVPAFVS